MDDTLLRVINESERNKEMIDMIIKAKKEFVRKRSEDNLATLNQTLRDADTVNDDLFNAVEAMTDKYADIAEKDDKYDWLFERSLVARDLGFLIDDIQADAISLVDVQTEGFYYKKRLDELVEIINSLP